MCRYSFVLRWGAGLMIAFLSNTASGQELIEIERYVWTDSVDRPMRQYGRTYGSPIRARKAYLWMQLRGSPELLEQLRSQPDGSLPIRHEWYRYESDQISADLDVTVDLDIGRKSDLQKLSYEVDANGFFRWRIWSGKEHLSRGWWRVNVVYANNEPVLCSSTEGMKPCTFLIEVR